MSCATAPTAPLWLPRPVAWLLARPIDTLARLNGLHRQRCALARLEPRLLRDIGVTEPDVAEELDRPLWDAPRHWRG